MTDDGIPSAEKNGDGSSRPGLLSTLLEHRESVLILGGLAIYVLVRVAYDAVYNDLELTPEEVGLTYIAIVARAALGLLTYFVILLALTLIFIVFRSIATGNYTANVGDLIPERERPRILAFLVLGSVGFAAGTFLWEVGVRNYFRGFASPARWLFLALAIGATIVGVRVLYGLVAMALDAAPSDLSLLARIGTLLLIGAAIIAPLFFGPRLATSWGTYHGDGHRV